MNEVLKLLKEGKISLEEAKKVLSTKNSKGLLIDKSLNIDELEFKDVYISDPKDDEVMVEVKASAINFPDIMCIKGLYPTMPSYPFIPGFEVSGIVKKVGKQVKEFKVGDSIIAVTGDNLGGHCSIVNVKEENCVLKPHNITFEEGCSMPVAFGTVYYSFIEGKLKEEEKILIQTATGACGLMAIQLANLKNCEIFATSSKEKKLNILKRMNIPHIINYKTDEFDKIIKEITQNKGVDFVLNMVSGTAIQRGINSLGPSGRYIELAVHGLRTGEKLDLSSLVDNQTIRSIDLRRMTKAGKITSKKYLCKMIEKLERKEIIPIVSRIYPVSMYKEALKFVEKGNHIGKVVLSYEEKEVIDLEDKLIESIIIQGNKREEHQDGSINNTNKKYSDIAIIGMAGEFPRSSNTNELWKNISNKINCIDEVPLTRWDINKYYSSSNKEKGKSYSKWMGYLQDGDKFDELFFNIPPGEAEIMDPQQRKFLEVCYHCFENAGFDPSSLSEKNCGVFVGCSAGEYLEGISKEHLTAKHLTGKLSSILSSRISYYLNLKGPAVSYDTACSSSLVALCNACDSLLLDNCDMALAGGVTIITNANMHIMASDGNMLSKGNKCSSFDNEADGFIISEAVGVILLKRLEDAKRDKDNIIGVIKGWGINQDGKTNGITAPSSISQSNLEKKVYDKFNINPESISMIEAHGTGTKLGDPIEVEALKNAFSKYTNNKNYVALTSVKSNIGHSLAAAGISSVIKVLLAMKNKQIPPEANFNNINEHIDINNSPFYITKELKKWEKVCGVRRAAVSGFGFSGTNAHIVLEEYENEDKLSLVNSELQNVFILSAKTMEQLKLYSKNVIEYLNNNEISLSRFLYTYQNNRENMECRLAIICKDKEDLIYKLNNFLNNKEIKNNGMVSVTLVKKSVINSLKNKQLPLSFDINRNISKWLEGYNILWPGYSNRELSIEVPEYPFKKNSFWLMNEETQSSIIENKNVINDVFSINLSKYSFVKDHIVNDENIFPGVGYIQVISQLLKEKNIYNKQNNILLIEGIQWLKTYVCNNDDFVEVSFLGDAERIEFKVFNGDIVYCQGFIRIKDKKINEKINYDNTSFNKVINSSYCYDILKNKGLNYGDTFKTIEKIQVHNDKVIGHLVSQKPAEDINVGLIDGAMQSVIGFIDINNENSLLLPYEIEEVHIINEISHRASAIITKNNDNKYDIIIINENNDICIKLIGYSVKNYTLYKNMKEKNALYNNSLIYSNPQLIKKDLVKVNNSDLYKKYLIILSNSKITNLESLENNYTIKEIICDNPSIVNRIKYYGKEIIKYFKDFTNNKEKIMAQIITFEDKQKFVQDSIEGELKTISLEMNNINFQQVIYEQDNKNNLQELLLSNINAVEDTYVLYKDNLRYVKQSIEFNSKTKVKIPWKDEGIYLIWGGSRGIGFILAKEICKYVHSGKVIIVGRSTINEEITDKIKMLDNKIEYYSCNVCNFKEVKDLVDTILKKYKKINGCIQCAGIIKDSLLQNKDLHDIESVIDPKIMGTVNICEALKEEYLDLFVLYSSIAGAFGNIGQVDYSFGNSFMNSLANNLKTNNLISISWPLWKNGGMKLHESKISYVNEKYGIKLLEDEEGIEALYQCIESKKNNVIVLCGNKEKLRNSMPINNSIVDEKSSINIQIPTSNNNNIRENLLDILCNILNLNRNDLDLDLNFSDYGFDSISFTQLSDKINSIYALDLTPADFFKYESINEFLNYLYNNCPSSNEINNNAIDINNGYHENKIDYSEKIIIENKNINKDIAIIGVSCKFPQIENINEFWDTLNEGKNVITKIPRDRWNIEEVSSGLNEEVKERIKWGGFIDGVDEFDPEFFNITPKEAEIMDPQQRLLMTYVWKALEDAGYSKESLSGTDTALIIATGSSNYNKLIYNNNLSETFFGTTAMVPSVGPNKMSYFLDVHGTSMPVETACSSSLVAINKAISEIRNGATKLAVVGGINVLATPDLFISFGKAGMLSKDGKCKTFSKDANGYVRSEGVGMIVLKELKEAEKDGDNIYGVIKGSAVNHGGNANTFTSPNPNAQEKVINAALKDADVDPSTITYIEAHGTGTSLGDPIEINGLKMAFNNYNNNKNIEDSKNNYCGIGAVKSNIGHTELAAGIAGIIKVILQFKYKTLVKSLYCDEVNPYIKLNNSPFYIVNNNKFWDRLLVDGREIPRRAGVSSFGFGGVNAHVILEEYVNNKKNDYYKLSHDNIIVLSAATNSALNKEIVNLYKHIQENDYSDKDLINISYTLQIGRTEMERRIGFVVNSINDLKDKLAELINNNHLEEKFYYVPKKEKLINPVSENLNSIEVLNFWLKGNKINWNELYNNKKINKLSLPTYPFDYEKYWINKDCEKTFEITIYKDDFEIKDHVVNNKIIVPAVKIIESIYEGFNKYTNSSFKGLSINNICFRKSIEVQNSDICMRFTISKINNTEYKFMINYLQDLIAEGTLTNISEADEHIEVSNIINEHKYKEINIDNIYEDFANLNIEYGTTFKTINKIYKNNSTIICNVLNRLQNNKEKDINIQMIDGVLQSICGFFMEEHHNNLRIPAKAKNIKIYDSTTDEINGIISLKHKHNDLVTADIKVCDNCGKVIMEFIDLEYRSINVSTINNGQNNETKNIFELIREGKLSFKEFQDLL